MPPPSSLDSDRLRVVAQLNRGAVGLALAARRPDLAEALGKALHRHLRVGERHGFDTLAVAGDVHALSAGELIDEAGASRAVIGFDSEREARAVTVEIQARSRLH